METKNQSLNAKDFFEKLQADKLETETPISLIGMVKKSDSKEKIIEFAPGGRCEHWVKIPLELIESVEVLTTIPCKDHSHPLVKLIMSKPKTTEGKVYFELYEGVMNMKDNTRNFMEGNLNQLHLSSNSQLQPGPSDRSWFCNEFYCGCYDPIDCFLLGYSGNCRGKRVICGRNGCVCIPPRSGEI